MKNLVCSLVAACAVLFSFSAGATDCFRSAHANSFVAPSFFAPSFAVAAYSAPSNAFFVQNRIGTLDAYGNVVVNTAFNPYFQFRSLNTPVFLGNTQSYAFNLPPVSRSFAINGFNSYHGNFAPSAVVVANGHKRFAPSAQAVVANGHGVGAQAFAAGGNGLRSRSVATGNKAVASQGGLLGFGFIGPNASRAVVKN